MLQKDIDRFWSRVVRKDGCWEFLSPKNRDGYHSHLYQEVPQGKFRKTGAHRFMMMVNGHTIPEGYVVCHSCDNPGCVNPDHLWIGTVNDNNQDKVRKGRQSAFPGMKNAQAKLDDDTVRKIRAEAIVGARTGRGTGSNVPELARKYNVHTETIRLIAKNRIWKHV